MSSSGLLLSRTDASHYTTNFVPTTLLAFILIFIAGTLLRSCAVLTKKHADFVARFVFSISLPATILVSLDRVDLDASSWKLPAAAAFVVLPLLCVAWGIARLLHLPRPSRGAFIVSSGIMNMAFFAYPVILATFGSEGLARALLFDVGHGVLVFTIVYAVAIGHGAQTLSPSSALLRFVSAPPLWAVSFMVMMKLIGATLPVPIHQALTPIHWTTTPLASLMLGLSLDVNTIRGRLIPALTGTALRMGGGFLLGNLASDILGLSHLERAIVMISAAMPAGLNAVIFSTEERLDVDLAAAIVALSICVGIALLPILPGVVVLLAR